MSHAIRMGNRGDGTFPFILAGEGAEELRIFGEEVWILFSAGRCPCGHATKHYHHIEITQGLHYKFETDEPATAEMRFRLLDGKDFNA